MTWHRRGSTWLHAAVLSVATSVAATGCAQGPIGAAGPRGPAGEQGAQGQVGQDGEDGQDGTDGTDGQAGTDGTDGQDGVDGQAGNVLHLSVTGTAPAGAVVSAVILDQAGAPVVRYGTTIADMSGAFDVSLLNYTALHTDIVLTAETAEGTWRAYPATADNVEIDTVSTAIAGVLDEAMARFGVTPAAATFDTRAALRADALTALAAASADLADAEAVTAVVRATVSDAVISLAGTGGLSYVADPRTGFPAADADPVAYAMFPHVFAGTAGTLAGDWSASDLGVLTHEAPLSIRGMAIFTDAPQPIELTSSPSPTFIRPDGSIEYSRATGVLDAYPPTFRVTPLSGGGLRLEAYADNYDPATVDLGLTFINTLSGPPGETRRGDGYLVYGHGPAVSAYVLLGWQGRAAPIVSVEIPSGERRGVVGYVKAGLADLDAAEAWAQSVRAGSTPGMFEGMTGDRVGLLDWGDLFANVRANPGTFWPQSTVTVSIAGMEVATAEAAEDGSLRLDVPGVMSGDTLHVTSTTGTNLMWTLP